jgi:imidazolonepropionase
MTFSTTFLGAHAFPKDRTREEYMRDLLEKMLPTVVRKKLADACDVFVDEGYFTVDQARELLKKAKSLGLQIKIHADEFGNTESAALAADLGCLSADHLLRVSDRGISKLAASQTVGVLLPGTAFYLKAPHAPARKLIDAGVCVALSTDFNPGSCMTLNLPAIMTIAALYLGMSRAEIFASVTYNGAKALGLQARKGTLSEGMDADFSILPVARFEEIYYRFAW